MDELLSFIWSKLFDQINQWKQYLTYHELFLLSAEIMWKLQKNVWRRGVVVITTAQLHSTKPELRFSAGSNPVRGVTAICDGDDLWQWSRLEIRLYAFRSTIPQKQFIIIIIIIKCFQENYMLEVQARLTWSENVTGVANAKMKVEIWLEVLFVLTCFRLYQIAHFSWNQHKL